MLRKASARGVEGSGPPGADERSMAARAINSGFEALLFLLAGMVVIAAVGPIAGCWRYEVVESGSMTPALRTGGIAVVRAEPLAAVRVGQVLAFHPPGMANYVRIHRVVSLTRRGDQIWVVTKGDANNVADPGPIRLEGATAYTERLFVPYVGYLGVWLYNPSTRQALEGLLLALMVGGGLYLIWTKQDEAEPVPVAGARAKHVPASAATPPGRVHPSPPIARS